MTQSILPNPCLAKNLICSAERQLFRSASALHHYFIHHALRSQTPYDLTSLLRRRLSRLSLPISDHSAPHILSVYRIHLLSHKPYIVVAHQGAILNQWCTSRLFGLPDRPCPFGCGHLGDDIPHLLTCSRFQTEFHRALRQHDFHLDLASILLLQCPLSRFITHHISNILLYTHICFKAFNHCRHSSPFNPRLLQHLLSAIAHHCPSSGRLIRHLRASPAILLPTPTCPILRPTSPPRPFPPPPPPPPPPVAQPLPLVLPPCLLRCLQPGPPLLLLGSPFSI